MANEITEIGQFVVYGGPPLTLAGSDLASKLTSLLAREGTGSARGWKLFDPLKADFLNTKKEVKSGDILLVNAKVLPMNFPVLVVNGTQPMTNKEWFPWTSSGVFTLHEAAKDVLIVQTDSIGQIQNPTTGANDWSVSADGLTVSVKPSANYTPQLVYIIYFPLTGPGGFLTASAPPNSASSPAPAPAPAPTPAPTPAPAGDTQKPTTPGTPSQTSISTSSVSLSWAAATDNVGVTAYKAFNGQDQVVAALSGTSTTISNLTADTPYSFYVRAYDAAGNASDPSGTLAVRTSAAATPASARQPTPDGWAGFVIPDAGLNIEENDTSTSRGLVAQYLTYESYSGYSGTPLGNRGANGTATNGAYNNYATSEGLVTYSLFFPLPGYIEYHSATNAGAYGLRITVDNGVTRLVSQNTASPLDAHLIYRSAQIPAGAHVITVRGREDGAGTPDGNKIGFYDLLKAFIGTSSGETGFI